MTSLMSLSEAERASQREIPPGSLDRQFADDLTPPAGVTAFGKRCWAAADSNAAELTDGDATDQHDQGLPGLRAAR